MTRLRAVLSRGALAYARSPFMRLRLRPGGGAETVATLPQEPWFPAVTAAPGLAEEFYLGRYRLAGILRERPYPPFDAAGFGGEPEPWGKALHAFGWLRVLHDEGTPLARVNAQALTADWIALLGTDLRHPAWEPVVAARRLDAWLTHHAWLTGDAGDELTGTLAAALARHARVLRVQAGALQGGARVEVACVLALYHAATGSGSRGLAHLQPGLRDWKRAEGGPFSGDPRDAVRLLCLMERVKRTRPAPLPTLDRAIESLSRWLSVLRHADGRLAALHGTGHLRVDLLDGLLDEPSQSPGASKRAVRLAGSGRTVAILDGGNRYRSAGAFELSTPAGRIVVSCNVPERRGALRDALKAAAAHSTLDTAGEMRIVEPVALKDGGAELAVARGDLVHTRRLAFEPEGLAGIDRVRGPAGPGASGGRRGSLRFHLHPTVTALREGPHAVALALPNPSGALERWTFHCIDAAVALDETVVFAESAADFATGHGRPSTQIVVELPDGGDDGSESGTEEREVRWMFVHHS